MHKVFINDKPIIFENIYHKVNGNNRLLILSDSEFSIDDIKRKLSDSKTEGILYLCASPDQAWNDFLDNYTLIEAAGGIVKNENEELLIIYRKKKWDLPKGKLEYDETPEDAAIREVKEECGIKKIQMEKFLLKTYHTYTEKSKSILKKTHWYSMSSTDNGKLKPQIEEEIEKVLWMRKEIIFTDVFDNTYESIKDVLLNYYSESNVKTT
jgi:8-oxo-dGTP pyrophosphatase MutT (NUDIX family)